MIIGRIFAIVACNLKFGGTVAFSLQSPKIRQNHGNPTMHSITDINRFGRPRNNGMTKTALGSTVESREKTKDGVQDSEVLEKDPRVKDFVDFSNGSKAKTVKTIAKAFSSKTTAPSLSAKVMEPEVSNGEPAGLTRSLGKDQESTIATTKVLEKSLSSKIFIPTEDDLKIDQSSKISKAKSPSTEQKEPSNISEPNVVKKSREAETTRMSTHSSKNDSREKGTKENETFRSIKTTRSSEILDGKAEVTASRTPSNNIALKNDESSRKEPSDHSTGSAVTSPPVSEKKEKVAFAINDIKLLTDGDKEKVLQKESKEAEKNSIASISVYKERFQSIWNDSSPYILQGNSLRTWSITSAERVQVLMKSGGRPMHADVELWNGPYNTPLKLKIYTENGELRPFNAVIATPGGRNSIAVRNAALMTFPVAACVQAVTEDTATQQSSALIDFVKSKSTPGDPRRIEGDSIRTFSFNSAVAGVRVLLKTNGRPLHAKIELLQGPGSAKQSIDVYSENGMERPFYAVMETPGSGSVIRVVNTGTGVFPMTASVEPYLSGDGRNEEDSVMEWDPKSSNVCLIDR